MIKHIWSAAIPLAIMLGGAVLAQQNPPANLPQPDYSINGPAGTATRQTTRQTNYPNGAQVDTTKKFEKTQSYGNSNGMLSARTKIKTQGPVTTINGQAAPAYQSTSIRTQTTTTQPQ